MPAYLVLGVIAILTVFSPAARLSRAGRWCLWAAGLLFAYILIRAANSPVPYLARQDFYLALAALAVYGLNTFFITGLTERMSIVWLLLALAGFEVVIGTRQFVGNDWLPFGLTRQAQGDTIRASGTFINPAHLAGFLEIMAPFALAIAFWGARRIWVRLLAGYMAGVCYFGIAITASRGSWISAAFAAVVFVILSRDLVRRTSRSRFPVLLYLSVFAALALVAGAVYFMRSSNVLSYRLDTVSGLTDQKKIHDIRVYNWLAALDQWQEARWLGTGAGTHLYYGRKYRREELQADPEHAHSDYLEFLAEYGLAGFALLLPFLFFHARSGWHGYRRWSERRAEDRYQSSPELALNLGALCAFVSYLAHSMVDFNLHLPGNALCVALVCALLANPGEPQPAPVGFGAEEEPPPSAPPLTLAGVLPRLALPALGAGLLLAIGSRWRGEIFSEQARAGVRDRHFPEAIALAQASLALDPANPYTYQYLGDAYRLQFLSRGLREPGPELAQSEEAYRRAIALFDQEMVFWIALGQTLDAEGKYSEARVAYERAVALDPKFWYPRAFLARHFQRIGDPIRENFMWLSAQRLVMFDVKKYFISAKHNSSPTN